MHGYYIYIRAPNLKEREKKMTLPSAQAISYLRLVRPVSNRSMCGVLSRGGVGQNPEPGKGPRSQAVKAEKPRYSQNTPTSLPAAGDVFG